MKSFTRMCPKLAAFRRYRPRILTLLVLIVVGALLVLANLSFDLDASGDFRRRSYGWPLIWNRYVLLAASGNWRTVGWYLSAPRLAGDLAMWLVMLAASSAACEWLLRRYRPRLRSSLRTMLAAVGLSAVFCGWFAAARNRANVQDPVIAAPPPLFTMVPVHPLAVERWGPKWLDLVGADRFRRRIISVCASLGLQDRADEDEKHLKRLGQLPELLNLSLTVDRLTPALRDALADMPQLRSLGISRGYGPPRTTMENDEQRTSHECLAAIGKMTRLELLDLSGIAVRPENLRGLASLTRLKSLKLWQPGAGDQNLRAIGDLTQLEYLWVAMRIDRETLASLSRLTNLKSLYVDDFSRFGRDAEGTPLLSRVPALSRLEAVDLDSSRIRNDDLRRLAVLRHLKSLDLQGTPITSAGLAELASLESLEELAISGKAATAEALESLRAVKHLKKLHIGRPASSSDELNRLAHVAIDGDAVAYVPHGELDHFVRALAALRRSRPGIVIDEGSIEFEGLPMPTPRNGWPWPYDAMPVRDFTWLPTSGAPWMTPAERAEFEEQGGCASFDAAEWRDEEGRTSKHRRGMGFF